MLQCFSLGINLNVLITGGAGLLGSQLCRDLADRGLVVTSASRTRVVTSRDSRVKYLEGDLCNEAFVSEIFEHRFDYVIQCAGVKANAGSQWSLSRLISEPIRINSLCLEYAVRSGVSRFFLLSSTTVYPPTNEVPCIECQGFDSDPDPAYQSIGWMYRFLEKLARDASLQSDLAVTILRPSNIFGPGDNFSKMSAQVIPSLIRNFVECSSTYTVWGDGNQTRDFIYVRDVSQIICELVLRSHVDGPFNIASGVGTKIRDLASCIASICNVSVSQVVYDHSKPVKVKHRVADITHARKELGFFPQYSLRQGLEETIQWYLQSLTSNK